MKTKNLVKGALLVALGVIIPQIFHLIGGRATGTIFMPMHIPVLLAGFLIGPITGLYVGILAPVLSYLFTGMPPIAPVPILPMMIFELAIYGLVSGILYNKLKINLFVSLIGAMIAGRLAYGLTIYIMLTLFNINLPGPMAGPLLAIVEAVRGGIIGIVLQIIIIPVAVKLLEGDTY